MAYELTWLGHSTFHLRTGEASDGGRKSFLIEPWVQGNPACPDDWKSFGQLDGILITHGHFDHMGDAVALAETYPCPVVAIIEVCEWLKRKGLPEKRAVGMNKGGTVELSGLRATMVQANHSGGIHEEDGTISYGGEAAGFVLTLPSGERIYHAGDTNVFSDMGLIGELYQPDLALLPIGDHFTMGPFEAAKAIELLGVKKVIPMHFGTFPILTGTPDALREATSHLAGVEIVALEPGQTFRA